MPERLGVSVPVDVRELLDVPDWLPDGVWLRVGTELDERVAEKDGLLDCDAVLVTVADLLCEREPVPELDALRLRLPEQLPLREEEAVALWLGDGALEGLPLRDEETLALDVDVTDAVAAARAEPDVVPLALAVGV